MKRQRGLDRIDNEFGLNMWANRPSFCWQKVISTILFCDRITGQEHQHNYNRRRP